LSEENMTSVLSPSSDSPVLIANTGKYLIKETLGEGGFSKVKLGVHE